MLAEVQEFWNSLMPKISKAIAEKTGNCVRRDRFDVSTAPNGEKIGVRQPYGSEIFLPYGPTVAGAAVGQSVIVEWRGSLSTGIVTSYGDGIIKSGVLTANLGTTWSGNGPYTQNVSVPGMSPKFTPEPLLQMPTSGQSAAISAFENIVAVEAGTNSVTVYAKAQTTTAITLLLKL